MRSGHFLQKLLNYCTGQVRRSREQIMNDFRAKLSGYNVEYSDIAHFFGAPTLDVAVLLKIMSIL